MDHKGHLDRNRQGVLTLLSDLTTDKRPLFKQDVEVYLPAPLDGGQAGALTGVLRLEETLFDPLYRAFQHPTITPDMVLADEYQDAAHVAVMGRLASDQVAPYLGIPAGPDRVLRFGLFFRFEGACIDRMHVLFDVPSLASQAGIELLQPGTGRPGIPARPAGEAGLNLETQDTASSAMSRDLVSNLIGGLNKLKDGQLASMPQQDFWTDDMQWLGPHGVGICHGFEEYQRFAQGPSVAAFPDRKGLWPKPAFLAEGEGAAFVGWPSLVGTFNGQPFRGFQPTGGPIGQRIMDFYVRRGDKLAQNWVFIDLIDFARQCGVDVMAPLNS